MNEKKAIYLDDAIDAVAEGLKRTFVEYRDVAEKMLNNVPSAQPKKGKWIEHKDYPGLAYLCSECGYFTTMRTNFCPNCGADMRGEQNDSR